MYFPGQVKGGQLRMRQSPSTSGTFIQWIPNETRIDCYTFTVSGYKECIKAMSNGSDCYDMSRYLQALDGTLYKVTT